MLQQNSFSNGKDNSSLKLLKSEGSSNNRNFLNKAKLKFVYVNREFELIEGRSTKDVVMNNIILLITPITATLSNIS